jgi:tripartite-type tricarboxylate transporter receptor subunit TctC
MKKILTCLTGALLVGSVDSALSQHYPARPIRMVVPFAAGGGTDVVARVIAPKLGQQLGQNVIIDNRTGASGNVGAEIVARATPDGYTVIMGNVSSHAINASVFKLPYDPVKDFAAVSVVAIAANVLVVHPSFAAKSVRELIAAAAAAPGKIDYASAGNGSPAHLAGELFKLQTGVRATHVPYQGLAKAIADLMSGTNQYQFITPLPVMELIAAGKLRALAVTGPARFPALPDVPTVGEAGFPDLIIQDWFGILVKAGTPDAVVARLNETMNKALAKPRVREAIAKMAAEPAGGTPAEFGTFLKSEMVHWGNVVKDSGIKM